jgi:hypothetical protein
MWVRLRAPCAAGVLVNFFGHFSAAGRSPARPSARRAKRSPETRPTWAVELAAVLFLLHTAPLLEEERHARGGALVMD